MSTNKSDANGLENESNDEFTSYPDDMFISCNDMIKIIKNWKKLNQGKPYLIIDIRKREYWNESRIKVKRCVNIEPNWINHKIMGYSFEDLIKDERRIDEYRLYLDRNYRHLDRIILMDWTTTATTLTPKNPLSVYNVILKEKDFGELPPPIYILEGGYKELLKKYPRLTTNPDTIPPINLENPEITSPIYFPGFMNLEPGVFDFIVKGFLPIKESTSIPTESPPRHQDVDYTLQLLQLITEKLEESIELEKETLKMMQEILEKINRRKKVDEYQAKMKPIDDQIKKLRYDVAVLENELSDRDFDENWKAEDKQEKSMFEAEIQKYKRQLDELEVKQAVMGRKLQEISKQSKLPKPRPKHRSQSAHANRHANLSESMNFPNRSSSQPNVSQPSQQSTEQIHPMEIDEQMILSPQNHEQEKERESIDKNDLFKVVTGSRIAGTTGLENPHNLCYANCIVQCLSNIAPFRDHFLNNDETISGELSMIMSFIMKTLWEENVESMTIEPLKNVLAKTKKNFNNNNQQDCQEFLVYLFELLHDELRRDDEDLLDNQRSPDAAMNEMFDGKSSIISKFFYGQTRFNITCIDCGNQSKSAFEGFSIYLVHLPKGKTCDLNECISDLLSEQESDRECCRCGEKNTMQTLEFTCLPKILIIHLNRFMGETPLKNEVEVNFTIELDMNFVTSSGDNENQYVLQGISCHNGNKIDGGHYVSYCNNLEDKEWYCYNDKTVTPVKEQDVLENKQKAYLLFYSKI